MSVITSLMLLQIYSSTSAHVKYDFEYINDSPKFPSVV